MPNFSITSPSHRYNDHFPQSEFCHSLPLKTTQYFVGFNMTLKYLYHPLIELSAAAPFFIHYEQSLQSAQFLRVGPLHRNHLLLNSFPHSHFGSWQGRLYRFPQKVKSSSLRRPVPIDNYRPTLGHHFLPVSSHSEAWTPMRTDSGLFSSPRYPQYLLNKCPQWILNE